MDEYLETRISLDMNSDEDLKLYIHSVLYYLLPCSSSYQVLGITFSNDSTFKTDININNICNNTYTIINILTNDYKCL